MSNSTLPATEQALTRLKSLLPDQFAEVVFLYPIPPAHLDGSQTERAIQVIRYAQQHENDDLARLLSVIDRVIKLPAQPENAKMPPTRQQKAGVEIDGIEQHGSGHSITTRRGDIRIRNVTQRGKRHKIEVD